MTRSWDGMTIFNMRFRSRRVSRIPWTFIAWWYVPHAALFYLSILNAVDNILRPEPFLVVLASLHSMIPPKGIFAVIARIFANLFTIYITFQPCRFVYCLLLSKLIGLFVQFPYPTESSPFISLLIPMFSTHSRAGCHSGLNSAGGFFGNHFGVCKCFIAWCMFSSVACPRLSMSLPIEW